MLIYVSCSGSGKNPEKPHEEMPEKEQIKPPPPPMVNVISKEKSVKSDKPTSYRLCGNDSYPG